VTNDFVEQTTYDALDRVIERIRPFDPGDARYNTPDKVTYTYDDASRLTRVSAPPSQGQTVRNDTRYAYFDNGWVKSSTDPWDILTTYDYNQLGQQTRRTVLSSGQAASRAMTWSYYPDGKLHTRTDDGVPVGRQVVVVDNTDLQNVQVVGTWPTATANPGQFKGFNYQTHAAGTGANTFTWKLNIPQDGTYQVFVRYAVGPATNAPYAVTDGTGPPRPGWSTRPSRPASGSALAASRSTPAWVQDHAVGSGQQHRGRRRGDAGPRQQRRCRQRAQGLRVPV
jgi:YD repeat-containing protein